MVAQLSLSSVLIAVLAVVIVGLLAAALVVVIRSRKLPVVSGRESLVGASGTAVSDLSPRGLVQVRGELWTAVAQGGPIRKGDEVRVVGSAGLSLRVVKAEQDRDAQT
jgi:membrane-bound serine protease (ClpP class)